MSSIKTEKADLQLTEDEDAARYVEILRNDHGFRLDIGGIYEIRRSYGSPQIYGDEGEMYVIDNDGKDAYGFQWLCETNFYE